MTLPQMSILLVAGTFRLPLCQMYVQLMADTHNQSDRSFCPGREASGEKLDMEAERRLRTPEEMATEARELRKAMADFDQ